MSHLGSKAAKAAGGGIGTDEGATIIGEFSCVSCKAPTPMTKFAFETVGFANGVLRSRGMDIMGPDEFVLCDECTRLHRAEQDRHFENQRRADSALWAQFKEDGINEAALRSQINDRGLYVEFMLPAWKALQRRGNEGKGASGAGF